MVECTINVNIQIMYVKWGVREGMVDVEQGVREGMVCGCGAGVWEV